MSKQVTYNEIYEIFKNNLLDTANEDEHDVLNTPMTREAFERLLADFIPKIEDALIQNDADILHSVLTDVVDQIHQRKFGPQTRSASKQVYKCVKPYNKDTATNKQRTASCRLMSADDKPELNAYTNLTNCTEVCRLGNDSEYAVFSSDQRALVPFENNTSLATVAKIASSLFVASIVVQTMFAKPHKAPVYSGNTTGPGAASAAKTVSSDIIEIVGGNASVVNITGYVDIVLPGTNNVTAMNFVNETLLFDPPVYSKTTMGKACELGLRSYFGYCEQRDYHPNMSNLYQEPPKSVQPELIPRSRWWMRTETPSAPDTSSGWKTTLQMCFLLLATGAGAGFALHGFPEFTISFNGWFSGNHLGNNNKAEFELQNNRTAHPQIEKPEGHVLQIQGSAHQADVIQPVVPKCKDVEFETIQRYIKENGLTEGSDYEIESTLDRRGNNRLQYTFKNVTIRNQIHDIVYNLSNKLAFLSTDENNPPVNLRKDGVDWTWFVCEM